ncbi:MAG TPA: hypothetical protein VGQ79_00530 [Nitrospiraceae bacterium]|jgi:hypothetical protein|nr:hypothetical protein [Nitrospiraceae bacterium]
MAKQKTERGRHHGRTSVGMPRQKALVGDLTMRRERSREAVSWLRVAPL